MAQSSIELLPTAGKRTIGTRIYTWTDPSRKEKAPAGKGMPRTLLAQIWYAAEITKRAMPTAAYVPQLNAYGNVWEPEDIRAAASVRTHSYADAPVKRSGALPVVLICHGWQGTRTEYTMLAEELASHGYVVVGLDQPFMGRIALDAETITEPTEMQFANGAEVFAWYTADVMFALAQVRVLNEDRSGPFFRRLDVAHIAGIGHSSGFVGISGACQDPQALQACVNVDAPRVPAERIAKIAHPLLWLDLQKAGDLPAHPAAVAWTAKLSGTRHSSVEDWAYIEAHNEAEKHDAAKNIRIIRGVILAFADRYLRSNSKRLKQLVAHSPVGVRLAVQPNP